jgi:hypothetical protein
VPWRFLEAGHLSALNLVVAGIQKPAQNLPSRYFQTPARISRLTGKLPEERAEVL